MADIIVNAIFYWMKIAIISAIITSTADPRFYSSQQLNIASELISQGDEVDIYTLNRQENSFYKEVIDIKGSKIIINYFPPLAKILCTLNIPIMKGLYRRLKRKKYDIIQLSDDTQPTTVQVALQKKNARIVIFQGINHYSKQKAKKTLMKIFDSSLGRIIRRRTDLVIAKTMQAANFMKSKKYSNVVTIPMGVDIQHFYPRDKKESRKFLLDKGISKKDFLALYVGSLSPLRNVQTILRATKIVKHKGIDIGLIIVGEGNEKLKLQHMVNELKIDDVVYFLKPIPNHEMPLIYSAADVFLFASLYEIFGMVILEAMACGIPVISTPVPAIEDIVSANPKNGISIFPFSLDQDLARQIISLASNRSLIFERGEANFKIAQNYSWRKIGERFFEEYSRLVQ